MPQSLVLLAALTAALAGSASAGDPRRGTDEEIRVIGRVELTAPAADEAARTRLDEQLREQIVRRGEALLTQRRPFWLPESLARRALGHWVGRVDPLSTVEVVDSIRHQHDHGGYRSFRTELVVRPDPDRTERLVRGYARVLDRTAVRFGAVVGGSVVWWGLCAFLWFWFDRVSRGYMTGRLCLVFVGMGLTAPGIALLFV